MRSMQIGGGGGIMAADKSCRRDAKLMLSMQEGGGGGIMAASESCRKEANDAEHAGRRQRRDNGCE